MWAHRRILHGIVFFFLKYMLSFNIWPPLKDFEVQNKNHYQKQKQNGISSKIFQINLLNMLCIIQDVFFLLLHFFLNT